MAKASLTYDELQITKEMLSLAIIEMRNWSDDKKEKNNYLKKRSAIMSVIFKLENPKESNGKEKERK